MIDNVTLMHHFKFFSELNTGNPFEYKGLTFSPMYNQGHLKRYEARIKNLRLFVYPEKVYLINSLHKFYHGTNGNDFYLSELKQAIDAISDLTGINWNEAIVKKLEYGVNIESNADSIINSILSFKGKDYLPMIGHGKKYGTACEFCFYRLKAYDKVFSSRIIDKIFLSVPLLRWEIQIINMCCLSNKLRLPLKVKDLLSKETLGILAKDALIKYNLTIKMQQIHLHKLTVGQKKILAVMQNPLIRDDLKKHNKDTYKRDNRIYRRFMADKSICGEDQSSLQIAQKFEELING